MIHLRRLLVATDFTSASCAALAYGRAIARDFDAQLHVVTVVDNFFQIVGVEGYFTGAGGHQWDAGSAARDLLDAAVCSLRAGHVRATAIVMSASETSLA